MWCISKHFNIKNTKKLNFSRKGVKLRPEPPVGTLPFLDDCITYGNLFFIFIHEVNRNVQNLSKR